MTGNLISVRDYLRLIFRRKTVLVIPLILATLMVPLLWAVVPTKYRAEAIVKRLDLGMVERAGGGSGRSNASLRTLRPEILTYDNLDRVINQLNLDTSIKTSLELQEKYEWLKKAVSINLVARDNNTEIINISAIGEERELARDIANAIADNYVEESMRSNRKRASVAVEFLRERAQGALTKLRETEKKLGKYREKYPETLPRAKQHILNTIMQLETEQTSRMYQLTALKNRLNQIDKQKEETPEYVVAEETKEDNPEYLALDSQIAARKSLLERLLLGKTEEHDDVVYLRQEIKRMEKRLAETEKDIAVTERKVVNPTYQSLMAERFTSEQEIKGLEAALIQIQADIAAHQSKAQSVVSEEKTYNDMLRESSEYQQQYDKFRRSLDAAETEFDVETSRFGTQVELIQRALLPAHPWRMERLQLALACLAGGAAVGVGLMFALEFCDHSLRSVDDAASFLPIPILGSVSVIVSPYEVVRRRQRRILVFALIVGTILTVSAGLYLWEHHSPGAIQRMIEKGQEYLR